MREEALKLIAATQKHEIVVTRNPRVVRHVELFDILEIISGKRISKRYLFY